MKTRGGTNVPPGAMTAYFDFSPGSYDVRFVPAATADHDCTKMPDITRPGFERTAFLDLASDSWWSLLYRLSGNHDDAFSKFQDEHDAFAGQVRLRFANMNPLGTAMSFGFGTSAFFSPLFTSVPMDGVGAGPNVDTRGYVTTAPLGRQFAVTRFGAGNSGDVATMGVEIGADEVVSFFSYSINQILFCRDLAPANGLLSNCTSGPGIAIDAGTGATPGEAGADTSGSIQEFFIQRVHVNPVDIVLGPDGAFWFLERSTAFVGRMTLDGMLTEYAVRPPGDDTPLDVIGLSVGPDGALWFGAGAKVARMTVGGQLTTFPTPSGAGPFATTAGPDGNVWFTEGRAIGRITGGGAITEFSIVTTEDTLHSAERITKGSDGNLWFTDGSPKAGIGRLTPDGMVTYFPIPSGRSAAAVTLGPDGNVWFTETSAWTIGRVTPDGVVTEFTFRAPDPMNSPSGLGITSHNGEIWFTEPNSDRIGRMTTAGTLVQEYATGANGQPNYLAGSPDGHIWYADRLRNAIARLTP
jgi:virginiamycin B lyase